jgi:hypothetical protein
MAARFACPFVENCAHGTHPAFAYRQAAAPYPTYWALEKRGVGKASTSLIGQWSSALGSQIFAAAIQQILQQGV